ncbi:hypothetical protein HYFRA_00011216 [Hymenoscyphus fraxineus]|uniref:BTB domain-containing protein n=1 Tax=Hymenoscyphus fraxineus TaxID=746836 RepID=A0A9N9PWP7_9HELO|nr:hypothetical protein HYFRA_00011216 [Hymenoscyphus fraxineus]
MASEEKQKSTKPKAQLAVKPKLKKELRRTISFGTDILDLYVGPGDNPKHFKVHKKILCQKVEVFDKMFNGGFLEASESKAHFPEDNPESFAAFIQWVYTDEIHYVMDCGLRISPTVALLEKYQLPKLLKGLIKEFIHEIGTHKRRVNAAVVRQAYELTSEGSTLRKLCAWTVAYYMVTEKSGWPKDETEKVLLEVDGLLGDALTFLRKWNGSPPNPYHMPEGESVWSVLS